MSDADDWLRAIARDALRAHSHGSVADCCADAVVERLNDVGAIVGIIRYQELEGENVRLREPLASERDSAIGRGNGVSGWSSGRSSSLLYCCSR